MFNHPGLQSCARIGVFTLAVLWIGASPQAQGSSSLIVPSSLQELRQWDERTQSMLRDGELRVRSVRDDTLVAGRTIERADQYYKGVRVFGGDVARQLENGVLISLFGEIYPAVSADVNPAIDAGRARAIVSEKSGVEIGEGRVPELVILPMARVGEQVAAPADRPSEYRLAWRVRAAAAGDVREYFVDAHTGAITFDYGCLEAQAAVGRARGVLGDSKKISVTSSAGRFTAKDVLRPPSIVTLDMKGDLDRTLRILNGATRIDTSDYASDDDDNWTDGAVDDAHVYEGWTYDYYFKRFGRHGLDDRDLPITGIANPVRRADLPTYSDDVIGTFFLNAFYAGGGIMVYGVGLPPGFFTRSPVGNQTWDFLSGGIDIVAHELTHGVTDYSSRLIYLNESGALNEAFSDIMGTSVEFFFQPPGSGPMQADYLLGEDVIRPSGLRSMENPGLFGDPDHYSKRFLGTDDNGGVHINSGIANQAFYLAIEGGTNRTSGLSVQGVGGGNREQIEKVFYRAFTELLPSNATFGVARAATIQAARDLYGAGSAAERAVTEAWTAVGVE